MKYTILSLIWLVFIIFGCTKENRDEEGRYSENMSYGSFCHYISFGGKTDTQFTLKVGDVSFPVRRGQCSQDLGDACTALPTGRDVPIEVVPDSCLELGLACQGLTGSIDIEPGAFLIFDLGLDDESNLELTVMSSSVSESCEYATCALGWYTPETCASDDPCDWGYDGSCDDQCFLFTDDPFDDRGDCQDIHGGE